MYFCLEELVVLQTGPNIRVLHSTEFLFNFPVQKYQIFHFEQETGGDCYRSHVCTCLACGWPYLINLFIFNTSIRTRHHSQKCQFLCGYQSPFFFFLFRQKHQLCCCCDQNYVSRVHISLLYIQLTLTFAFSVSGFRAEF